MQKIKRLIKRVYFEGFIELPYAIVGLHSVLNNSSDIEHILQLTPVEFNEDTVLEEYSHNSKMVFREARFLAYFYEFEHLTSF